MLVDIFREKLGGKGKTISGTTSDSLPLPGTEGFSLEDRNRRQKAENETILPPQVK